VFSRPRVSRSAPNRCERGTPIATSTCDGSEEAEVQAEPLEA
jgi:hypothetical protein